VRADSVAGADSVITEPAVQQSQHLAPTQEDECVKAVLRCRPLYTQEINDVRLRIVNMDLILGQVSARNPELEAREPAKMLTIDQVYYWDAIQIGIFNCLGPGELQGIIPSALKHIFNHTDSGENTQFLGRASYLEIYNEEFLDMLSLDPKHRQELKESSGSGVYVKGLNWSDVVKSVHGIQNVVAVGAPLTIPCPGAHFAPCCTQP